MSHPKPRPRFAANVSAIYQAHPATALARPVYQTPVAAGFPSPAEDYLEGRLDLNTHLIRRPLATFFIRVIGDSMEGAKIFHGDLLVVDRAELWRDGDIVVTRLYEEFCVKRLRYEAGRPRLCSTNPKYPDIQITEDTDWEVWAKVIWSITKH